LNQRMATKHRWHSEEDQLAAEAHHFQNQWSPLFTLSRLGYRWSVGSVGSSSATLPSFTLKRVHRLVIG
jgi:hypothetical protein